MVAKKIKNLLGRIGLKLQRMTGHEDPDVLHRYKHYEDIIRGEKETIARLENALTNYKIFAGTNTGVDKRNDNKRNIIFVSHDAHPHGAQINALNMIRQLRDVFKYNIHVILKTGGGLLNDFSKVAYSLLCLDTDIVCEDNFKKWVLQTGANRAMCNTVLSGDVLKSLSDLGITCISMIHEMENIIRRFHCEENLAHIIAHARHIVLPSRYVQKSINNIRVIPEDKLVFCPQGIYNIEIISKSKSDCKAEICRRFNLPKDCRIVLNVGYAHHRKGEDLFARCAVNVCRDFENCIFLWVGPIADNVTESVKEITKGTAAEGKVIFTGLQSEMYPFYFATDVFLLTSREDPFPAVVMEAMNYCVPVVAFDGGGGYVELITPDETGFLAPMEDTETMSSFVSQLLGDTALRTKFAENARERVKEISNFNSYVGLLLSLVGEKHETVSVVIPNYNYAHHLLERIESILSQTYPVNEIIILDDASTDKSADIISTYENRYPLRIRSIINSANSGNVFSQWERGIKEAAGDYIWIAEADDKSDFGFLQSIMDVISSDDEIVMGYTQSKAMDENGVITADNYLFHTDDVDKEIYKTDYIADGHDEIKSRLSVKNTIPNVSAVVFRNSDKLVKYVQDAKKYKVAGDLRFYIDVLKDGGKICFVSESLNYHRRHTSSVTKELDAQRHYDEICECQQYVADLYFDGKLSDAMIKYRKTVREYLF
ncbi:MAG: glycosyltransferase [Oscillospiraceae bacterium]|nr:glycosyltransferase [Oscillospiraceae bacterium]MCL2278302.1 glycosyltransferase [Oscillospiraceae bacterium]